MSNQSNCTTDYQLSNQYRLAAERIFQNYKSDRLAEEAVFWLRTLIDLSVYELCNLCLNAVQHTQPFCVHPKLISHLQNNIAVKAKTLTDLLLAEGFGVLSESGWVRLRLTIQNKSVSEINECLNSLPVPGFGVTPRVHKLLQKKKVK